MGVYSGQTPLPYAELKSCLKRTSTTGQGNSQCFSVMVTTTVCPTMRYSPLSDSWEKRPDLSSPTRVAPFSLAALLALASSEEGATLVSTLKVLAILTSLTSSKANALRVIPYVSLARDTTPPASPRSLGTMMKVAPQAVPGEAICWLVGIITRSSQAETAPMLMYLVTPQSVPWYNAGG